MAYYPIIPSPNLPTPQWRWTAGVLPRRIIGPAIRVESSPSFGSSLGQGFARALQNALALKQEEDMKRRLLEAEYVARQKLLGPYYQAQTHYTQFRERMLREEAERQKAGEIVSYIRRAGAISPSKAVEICRSLPPDTKALLAKHYPELFTSEGKLNMAAIVEYPKPETVQKAKEKAKEAREKKVQRYDKWMDEGIKWVSQGRATEVDEKNPLIQKTKPMALTGRAKVFLRRLRVIKRQFPELRDKAQMYIDYLEPIVKGKTTTKVDSSEGKAREDLHRLLGISIGAP